MRGSRLAGRIAVVGVLVLCAPTPPAVRAGDEGGAAVQRHRYVDAAREVGEHLLGRLEGIEGTNVYDGAAGVAAFLFELYGLTRETRWRAAAEPLLERALEGERNPGLYVGLSGPGYVCLDAWRVTGEKRFLDAARACAARLGTPEATDVISGAAGTGYFLLALYGATKDEGVLAQAAEIGDWLAGQARRADGRAAWPVAPASPRTYVGLSHGAAGVGLFFLALHRVTHEPEHLALAEEAAAFVLEHAEPDGEDGWRWNRLVPPDDRGYPVQWCHGSPGIGLFFLALARTPGGERYEDALARCLASTLRHGRHARATGIQCHGLSGNAELLVEVFRARGDAESLAVARTWAEDLFEGGHVRAGLGGELYSPAYMVGLAGIGRFLLRLAAPRETPPAFSPIP